MIIYILGLQQAGKSEIARQIYSAVNDNTLYGCQTYTPTCGQEILTIHLSSKCSLLQLALINSITVNGVIEQAHNWKKKDKVKIRNVSVELRELGGAMMSNWVDFIIAQVELSTATKITLPTATKDENAQMCNDNAENSVGKSTAESSTHVVKQTRCMESTLFALIYVVDATHKDQLESSIDAFCNLACNADSVCANWPILTVLNKCVSTDSFAVNDGADKVDVDDQTVLSLNEVEHAFLQVCKIRELNCTFMEVDLACGMGLGDMVYWIYNTARRGVKETLE